MQKIQHLITVTSVAMMLTSCGSSYSPGGGVSYVGGAPGTVCNPEYHNQGCFVGGTTPATVQCAAKDGAGAWAEIAKCGANQYCVEEIDPADASGVKKVATCKDVPQSGSSSGGTSSGGASSGGASSGGASSGGTSGGGNSNPAEEFECIVKACPAEVAACEANTSCNSLLVCAKACKDEACRDACGADIDFEKNPDVVALLVQMTACGEKSGCIENGGGSSSGGASSGGTTSGGTSSGGSSSGGSSSGGSSSGGSSSGGGSTSGGSSGGGTGSCGDLVCQAGETKDSCVIDCDPDVTAALACADQKCSSDWAACKANDTCMKTLICMSKCGDEACVTNCVTAGIAAGAILQSLGTCMENNCEDAGSSSGGSSSGGSSSGGSSSGASSGGSSGGGSGSSCADSKACKSGEECVDGACVSNKKTGSCQGLCGAENKDADCWCDAQCQEYGDCCPDKDTLCP